MRLWGFPAARFARTTTLTTGLAAAIALLCGAGAGYGEAARHVAQSSSRGTITLRNGNSFRPALGDWEGTINHLPASFALSYGSITGSERYGIDDLVAVRPAGCPAAAGHDAEDVLASSVPIPLGAHGSLGLGHFRFGGSLSGPRTAKLTRKYTVGGCVRTLNWTMHPATRRPVTDGLWKISFTGAGAETFHVQAGGRLATAITVPSEMTRCNGLSGKFDLFIGPKGTATLSQAGLRASARFNRNGGTGQLNSGGSGCAGGPFRFAMKLKRAAA